jgi:hypothetical protein
MNATIIEENYRGYFITGSEAISFVALDPHGNYAPTCFDTIEEAKKAIDEDIENSVEITEEKPATMKTVEMKRNFKSKDGYTRIVMKETPSGKINYRFSYCYPANEEEKFVEYVQNTYEMTKDEANKEYLRCKKQGFTLTRYTK